MAYTITYKKFNYRNDKVLGDVFDENNYPFVYGSRSSARRSLYRLTNLYPELYNKLKATFFHNKTEQEVTYKMSQMDLSSMRTEYSHPIVSEIFSKVNFTKEYFEWLPTFSHGSCADHTDVDTDLAEHFIIHCINKVKDKYDIKVVRKKGKFTPSHDIEIEFNSGAILTIEIKTCEHRMKTKFKNNGIARVELQYTKDCDVILMVDVLSNRIFVDSFTTFETKAKKYCDKNKDSFLIKWQEDFNKNTFTTKGKPTKVKVEMSKYLESIIVNEDGKSKYYKKNYNLI